MNTTDSSIYEPLEISGLSLVKVGKKQPFNNKQNNIDEIHRNQLNRIAKTQLNNQSQSKIKNQRKVKMNNNGSIRKNNINNQKQEKQVQNFSPNRYQPKVINSVTNSNDNMPPTIVQTNDPQICKPLTLPLSEIECLSHLIRTTMDMPANSLTSEASLHSLVYTLCCQFKQEKIKAKEVQQLGTKTSNKNGVNRDCKDNNKENNPINGNNKEYKKQGQFDMADTRTQPGSRVIGQPNNISHCECYNDPVKTRIKTYIQNNRDNPNNSPYQTVRTNKETIQDINSGRSGKEYPSMEASNRMYCQKAQLIGRNGQLMNVSFMYSQTDGEGMQDPNSQSQMSYQIDNSKNNQSYGSDRHPLVPEDYVPLTQYQQLEARYYQLMQKYVQLRMRNKSHRSHW